MEEGFALYYISVNNFLLHYYLLGPQEPRKSRLKRKKRCWMTAEHRNRTATSMEKTISELTAECGREFTGFVRMSATDFEIILQKLAPLISKNDTKFRKAIPAKVRVAITLRYLATGDSFRSLHDLFKISHQLISNIVHDGCAAIVVVLKNEIKIPANDEEWFKKEAEFHDIFPHCLGAIDAKRVVISPSFHGESESNDKNNFCMILMTLVDKKYRFIYADVSPHEINSDGRVFGYTSPLQELARKGVNLPDPSRLPGCDYTLPYIFVCDNAISLQKNVMIPFSGNHVDDNLKREFNRKLLNAWIVAENAFGAMLQAFRVLRKPIAHRPEFACNIVMACVLLHNFLRNSTSSSNIYTPPGFLDTISNKEVGGGIWRSEKQQDSALRPFSVAKTTRDDLLAIQVRDQFSQYFSPN